MLPILLAMILNSVFPSLGDLSENVDAIIFDCDGVLVDTEYLKFLAWKEALSAKNVEFALEEYLPLVGHSSKNILKKIIQDKGMDISDEVIALRNSAYAELQQRGVSPIEEMVKLARQLSEQRDKLGIKLGLASSASTQEIILNLKHVGLENAFDLIISGSVRSNDLDSYNDPEGKNKPKPYIYLEAAKRLNVSPSRCLVFEDTNAGIEAAASAGMIAIAVPNRFTEDQDFSKAAKVIHYSELRSSNF